MNYLARIEKATGEREAYGESDKMIAFLEDAPDFEYNILCHSISLYLYGKSNPYRDIILSCFADREFHFRYENLKEEVYKLVYDVNTSISTSARLAMEAHKKMSLFMNDENKDYEDKHADEDPNYGYNSLDIDEPEEEPTFFEKLQSLGSCTDGNCIIEMPVGMHTNGGCHCLDSLTREERKVVQNLLLRSRKSAVRAKMTSVKLMLDNKIENARYKRKVDKETLLNELQDLRERL